MTLLGRAALPLALGLGALLAPRSAVADEAILHLGSVHGSYGFAVDGSQPKFSTHRVLVGFGF